MSTRTITYRVCDGCHRKDIFPNGVEIVSTCEITVFCGPTKTLDLCSTCAEEDKYICRLCAAVHSDANPCDAQLRKIEENPHD